MAGVWALAAAVHAQVTLTDTGDGDARRLVLENQLVRAVVSPAGGLVESLVFKPTGEELTRPLATGQPGGLLGDRLWQQDYWRGDWLRQPYTVEILAADAGAASVRLTGSGRQWRGLTIAKTLTLDRGSACLTADYELGATDEADPRCRPDYAFHQAFAGPGLTYFPSESGVLVRPVGPTAEWTVNDPPRGWAGYRLPTGSGLAMLFDDDRVKYLRGSQRPGNTVEWVFRKVQAAPGETLRTRVVLAPFSGLSRVDGACPEFVAGLEVEGTRVAVQLSAVRTTAIGVTLAWYHLATGEHREFARTTAPLGLAAGASTAFRGVLPELPDGHVVLLAVLTTEQGTVQLEHPLDAPGDGVYAMLPDGSRVPEVPDTPTWQRYHPKDLDFSSLDVPTPHRVWVPRWAGGSPRVLALVPFAQQRLAVELAQRFDMQLTCAPLLDSTYYVLGDRVRSLKVEEAHEQLREQLKASYDVILLASPDGWKLLPDWARQQVVRKVESGTGLVAFVRGKEPEELAPGLPLEFEGYDRAWGRLTLAEAARPGPAGALPYAILPEIRASNGSRFKPANGKTDSRCLLETDRPQHGVPVVATGQLGRGRTVEACIGVPLGVNMSKLVFRAYDQVTFPAFDYGEYYYALTARLLYWAARKEGPVSLLDVGTTEGSPLVIRLTAAGRAVGQTAQVEVTLRDWFGNVLQRIEREEVLKRGTTTLTVELDPRFTGERCVADVIIRRDEAVLAFGAGAFGDPPVRISDAAPADRFVDAGGATRIQVKLQAEPPVNSELTGTIVDGGGRRVGTVTVPAARETTLELPVKRVIGQWYRVELVLRNGEQILHEAVAEGMIRGPRERLRYRACFWGGVGGSAPEALGLAWHQLYRDFGMNAEWVGAGDLALDARYLRMLDMPYSVPGPGMYANGGLTKAAAEDRPDAPGQMTPATFDAKRAAGRKAAETWRDAYVLQYSCGDENRGAPADTDFGKEALAAFRQWLRGHYDHLEALNRSWQTSFASFDEAMPMTEAEGREHFAATGSCAPWLDHRLFMKWAYARMAGSAVEGVHELDPEALVGASGTQESDVYGSRDWWQLARAYNALAGYGGLQTVEQESYNPALARLFWSGYSKPNPFSRKAIYTGMMQGNRGVAIFSARSHINPDMTLSEAGRAVRSTLLELQPGVGQLLASSLVQEDPVWLLQSVASIEGSYMLGEHAAARAARSAVPALCAAGGIAYRSLSYEQLADGQLPPNDCRLLLLVHASALSPAEVAAIRKYVAAGGHVAVEGTLAVLDGHGRRYPHPQLAELADSPRFHQLPEGTLAGFTAAAGNPGDPGSADALDATLQLFDRVLKEAGLASRNRLEYHDQPGRRVPWTELREKRFETTRLVAVLRDYAICSTAAEDIPADLKLGKGGAIYDVIAGRYLGTGMTVPMTVTNDTNRLFAILPQPVTGLELTLPPSAPRGRDLTATARVLVPAGMPGRHVLRLQVVRPDGVWQQAYSADFEGPGDGVTITIPFADNDPPGMWRLILRDAATGTTLTRELEVTP